MIRPDFDSQIKNHIIPSPMTMEYGNGEFIDTSKFYFEACDEFLSDLFSGILKFDGIPGNEMVFHVNYNVSLKHEEYDIVIAENKIVVEAASKRGFFYAAQTLRQLKVGAWLPPVHIHDEPMLDLRGFHTQLGNMSQINADDVISIIRKLGKFKMNTYFIEYEGRFPFADHHSLVAPNAFSREDIAHFESSARENHIALIPLVQCLGHVRHIGRHPMYRSLIELDERERFDQFCPLNEKSFNLFTEITSEILDAHPGGKYLHIGADETRSLGKCPECADKISKTGKGKLYLDYVNKVCEWVVSQGRIPIIWDDMLSAFPECISGLNRNAIVMYWDYWSVNENYSPFFVDRLMGNGVVHDAELESVGFSGITEPELTVLKSFSHAKNIDELLNGEKWQEFRHYLDCPIPGKFISYPYLRLFLENGFKVIAAPTALGNYMDDIYGLPNYERFRGNICSFAKKAKAQALMGMSVTSWYNFPPEILDIGIIDAAQNCWTK